MRVYCGFDEREDVAYQVACHSIRRHSEYPSQIEIVEINKDHLIQAGLYYRPTDQKDNKLHDMASGAPMSTKFAIARFLVPLLAQSGWALFVDCDVVAVDAIERIMDEADPQYAVMCVKHDVESWGQSTKMDGQPQTLYKRKNWSSVMLFNCDHPANRRLNLAYVNTAPGRDLHAFSWLHDEEIGALSPGWNWLVGLQERPAELHLAHFTLGGPWIEGWTHKPTDDLWIAAQRAMMEDMCAAAS